MAEYNSIFVLIPPFPDGEVVNAFLERTSRYTGDISLALVCKHVFSRSPGLEGMPSGLGVFHREIGYYYGDLETIVRRHTLFDFFSCGLPEDRLVEQWERIVDVIPGPVRLTRLPVLMGDNDGMRLECPECRDIQEKIYGFSFVHRMMVAPFVRVCPVHGVMLRKLELQGWLFDEQRSSKPTSFQHQMAWEYARRVSSCIETPRNKSPYCKETIIKSLADSRWISDSGRLYLKDVLKEFCSFFEGAFADVRLATLVAEGPYVEAAFRALTRPDRNLHPTWCLLFSWFSTNCQRAVRPIKQRKVKGRTSRPPLTKEQIVRNLSQYPTIGAAALAMHVDPSRLAFACKAFRVGGGWRPKRLDDEQIAAIALAFDSGRSIQEIQDFFGISQATVYRLRAALQKGHARSDAICVTRLENAKREWVKAVEDNPLACTTSIRHLHLAAWTYLRRHAPSWLSEHPGASVRPIRLRTKVRSRVLLNLFIASIEKAERACEGYGRRPKRKSMYRLRSFAGLNEYAYKSSISKKNHKWCGEAHVAFVFRRIKWACRVPIKQLPLSCLARLAGVRVSSVRKIFDTNAN